jgi:hypothetical protein
MREDLLHFIWRYRYFNQFHLFTEAGEEVQILFPGELNTDAGPDFRNARIRINGVLREGPVELHVAASDWEQHGHGGDPNYKNTILHVVWEDDGGTTDIPIPVLVLQHRVSKLLLGQYERWMKSRLFVPCAGQLIQVDQAVMAGWQDLLLLRRLQRRALVIRGWLAANRQHWEETTWWLMARSMGLPVNGTAFEAIARSIPLRLMASHRWEPTAVKALLLGQAGLLEPAQAGPQGNSRVSRVLKPVADEVQLRHWQQEYRFLQIKHRLTVIGEPLLFLRMRPAHSPARRLAQLAELFSAGEGWFARIREAESPRELERVMRVEGLGMAMKRGLLVNAFVPLLFAYGWLRKEPAYQEKSLRWLAAEKPEKNTLISHWQRLGVSVKTAAHSQSLLELKKNYCESRRCLDCAIGRALLQPSS